jgi:hypothetical protein
METLGELESLIKKFTSSTMVSSSSARENCPVHRKDAPSFVEEKVVTSVDAVEGLDRIGVPCNLINVLKIYHAYVRAEVFQDATSSAKKQREAADNFLTNLEAIVSCGANLHIRQTDSVTCICRYFDATVSTIYFSNFVHRL